MNFPPKNQNKCLKSAEHFIFFVFLYLIYGFRPFESASNSLVIMLPIGLYIHVPFCKSRCIYCDFFSTVQQGRQDEYVDALCRELELRKNEFDGHQLATVYLGGGTPSLLSEKNLVRIFNNIHHVCNGRISDQVEVTMECNPDDVDETFVNVIRQLPVNRVSMGAQTFNNELLRFLHRRHKSEQIMRTVSLLRDAGIANISIDLMFGFPNETLAEWERDISEALKLDVEHLSAYSLMYEEGTPLTEMVKQGTVTPLDEETNRLMYEVLIDRLADAGYIHYELSNWAKPGYESRHNSSYWQTVPYVGLGAGAHSYDLSSRSWNVSDLKGYIDAIDKGERTCERELIDETTRYNDLITTALRTRTGICLSSLSSSQRCYMISMAKQAIHRGWLVQEGDRIHLTRQGLFVSDDVFSDLIMLED